jgi:soluble lytic murein transglycosylase-like protein
MGMDSLENALWSTAFVLGLCIPILLPPFRGMPPLEPLPYGVPLIIDSAVRSVVSPRPVWRSCAAVDREALEAILRDSARKHHVRLEVLRAMVQRESGGRPCVVSSKGAAGVLQLMPATARHFGVRNVRDPMENIDAGTRFLKQLLERYNNNLKFALAAYNAGPGAVDRYGGVPPFAETQDYVERVSRALEKHDE